MKFICQNCGFVNEDPEHNFDEMDSYDEGAEYFWDWFCSICRVGNGSEYVMEETKQRLENDE